MSPQIVTGVLTGYTLDSLLKSSLAWSVTSTNYLFAEIFHIVFGKRLARNQLADLLVQFVYLFHIKANGAHLQFSN
jgi:hypothetical protein